MLHVALCYGECIVQIGFDEASVIDLPSIHSLHHLAEDDLATLKYLLWGRRAPACVGARAGRPSRACCS